MLNNFLRFLKPLLLAYIICIALSGCSKLEVSGNEIDFEKAQTISEGNSASEVVKLLGSPTYVRKYGGLHYIYIRETLMHRPIFQPDLDSVDVVIISFDEKNRVVDVSIKKSFDPDCGIDALDDKTKIEGNTPNPFKQILGNIGKYNESHKAPGIR